ncbi:MAG: CDP-alcohol phosphatidyltransferase family protein [Planctomycetaceae bacterium]
MPNTLRRPIATRDTAWAAAAARWLARRGVQPNAISVGSVVFATLAGGCLAATGHVEGLFAKAGLLFVVIVGIQGRLLCNLFDGMVAIEEARKTPSGAIFNELPDRFADAFILVGAGYAVPATSWSIELGWLAAVLAVTTAYVRALGGSVGAQQHFLGPMAKQHRMALLTVTCVVAIGMDLWSQPQPVFTFALAVVVVGCLVTIARRCRAIVRDLEGT